MKEIVSDFKYVVGVALKSKIPTDSVTFSNKYPKATYSGEFYLEKGINSTNDLFKNNPLNYPTQVTYTVYKLNNGKYEYLDEGNFLPSNLINEGKNLRGFESNNDNHFGGMNNHFTDMLGRQHIDLLNAKDSEISFLKSSLNDIRENGSREMQFLKEQLYTKDELVKALQAREKDFTNAKAEIELKYHQLKAEFEAFQKETNLRRELEQQKEKELKGLKAIAEDNSWLGNLKQSFSDPETVREGIGVVKQGLNMIAKKWNLTDDSAPKQETSPVPEYKPANSYNTLKSNNNGQSYQPQAQGEINNG